MSKDEFLQALIVAMAPVVQSDHPELTPKEMAKKTRQLIEALYEEFGSDFSI